MVKIENKVLFKIKIVQLLLWISMNRIHFFILFLYFNLLLIFLLFGFWNLLTGFYHLISILILFLFPFYYILKYRKNFKFFSTKATIFWLEEKNFKDINPLTSLFDKPIDKSGNKSNWIIHQKKSYEFSKRIKYYYPTLTFENADPLKIRYLISFILFVAIFWTIKNDKLKTNLLSILDFQMNIEKKEEIINSTAWIIPPKYTQILQKEINLNINDINYKKIEELKVPEKSKLKISIVTNSKHFKLMEEKKLYPFREVSEDNYEIIHPIEKNATIVLVKGKDIIKKFEFDVIIDRPPLIRFTSLPQIIDLGSVKFISDAYDDYRVRDLVVDFTKPIRFKHFLEDSIRFEMSLDFDKSPKKVKSYFYENLSSHIWSGYQTELKLTVSDDLGQKYSLRNKIRIPEPKFKDKLAKKIYLIRKRLALKKISIKEAEFEINNIKKSSVIKNNKNIFSKIEETLNILSSIQKIPLKSSNILYSNLWEISSMLEERNAYLATKEMNIAEQKLYDSIRQKKIEDSSKYFKNLKDRIDELVNMKNQTEYQDTLQMNKNETLKSQLKEMVKDLEDLLSIGSKDKLEQKMHELKQLSELLKSNRKIDKTDVLKEEKQKEIINRLSDLLNEQEIIMQESFNMAADRGMFEQSSAGSGGKSPKEKQDSLRNTLGNIMREIGASENEIPQELGRADRAMRQASRDLENGQPDRASNAQGRALEMIQRSVNKMYAKNNKNNYEISKSGEEDNLEQDYSGFSELDTSKYQGNSFGGSFNLPQKFKEQEARKIVKELYSRYNKKKSFKEKKYIENLLDWY